MCIRDSSKVAAQVMQAAAIEEEEIRLLEEEQLRQQQVVDPISLPRQEVFDIRRRTLGTILRRRDRC